MEKKGESGGRKSLASENIFVGNFWIKGLSKAKAGNLILLNLELDVNDILKVTAKEKATGLARTVTMDTANKGTGANLEEKRSNIASFLMEDDDVEADGDDEGDAEQDDGDVVLDKQELINRAKSLCKRAEGMIPDVNEEDAAELTDLLEKNRRAIAEHDWETVDRLNESLSDIQSAIYHAGKSWYLKKSPEAARLAFLSALSASDLVQVDRWYAKASRPAGESGISQDISLRPTSKIPAC